MGIIKGQMGITKDQDKGNPDKYLRNLSQIIYLSRCGKIGVHIPDPNESILVVLRSSIIHKSKVYQDTIPVQDQMLDLGRQ